MAKQKHALQTPPQNSQGTMIYQHQRGVIKENAIQALLHDKLFRQRVERNKKGKGSYQRQAKHANRYYEKPDNKISICLLYTSPSPRDRTRSRMPSSA